MGSSDSKMIENLARLVIIASSLVFLPASGEKCPYGGRCLPDEPCWPTNDHWQALNESVGGRLLIPELMVQPCLDEGGADSAECQQSLEDLGYDPFYLQKFPGGSESTGQVNAWTYAASSYAVEALDENDIVSAVNFARDFKIRLVVKGTGHDYYGRSSAPNSLLIWTHSMRDIEFLDSFIPAGGNDSYSAVVLGAGLTWLDVYAAASVDRNLYVQGGGCTSVGVMGWHIGGGYGSWSKKFGTGPANMLEAKVVTADGQIVVASEFKNEDLFYALRGGGFGFGVVVSLTVRTHPLPDRLGVMSGSVASYSPEGTRELVKQLLDFYKTSLVGPDWGEQVQFYPQGEGYRLSLSLMAQNMTREEMSTTWQPFTEWLDQRPENFTYEPFGFLSVPGRAFWNPQFNSFASTPSPHDPLEPDRGFYWMAYTSR